MSVARTNILSANIPVPPILSPAETAFQKWALTVAHALRFRRNGRVATSGASTQTVLSIQTEDAAVYAIRAYIVGRRVSGSGDANDMYASVLRGTFKQVSGTLSEVAEDSEFAVTDIVGATSDFAVSGAKILVRVTGVSGYEIVWRAFTQTVIARQ